jgi:excisionase family DNA binding protein
VQLLNDSRERFETGWNAAVENSSKSPLGLSTSQAARALGVSLGTIRRWSDMGYLESYRTPGGQRRFSREQIDQFIDSLERQSREFRDRATGVGS